MTIDDSTNFERLRKDFYAPTLTHVTEYIEKKGLKANAHDATIKAIQRAVPFQLTVLGEDNILKFLRAKAPEQAEFENLYHQCYERTLGSIRREFRTASIDCGQATTNGIVAVAQILRKGIDVIDEPCALTMKYATWDALHQIRDRDSARLRREALEVWAAQQVAAIEGGAKPAVEQVLNAEKRGRQGSTLYDVYREIVTDCEMQTANGPNWVGLRQKEAYERKVNKEMPETIAREMVRQYEHTGTRGHKNTSNLVTRDATTIRKQVASLVDLRDVRKTIFETARLGAATKAAPTPASDANPPFSADAVKMIKGDYR